MQYPAVLRPYPIPANELDRLSALYAYDILDTLPEPSYDSIVAVASALFHAPIALVSLVDGKRQWFKARCGISADATERDLSFCTHAMLEDRPMVVCDATKDERFKENPLVTGGLGIRFYVGAPIKTSDGLALGSLCVIDKVARGYPEQHQLDALANLAALVVEQLEFRAAAARNMREREERGTALKTIEEAWQASQSKLDEAQRIAHLGYWERNLQTSEISWSDECYRLFDLPPQSGMNFEKFQGLVEPKDLPQLRSLIARSLETGEPFIHMHRFARRDGIVVYLESHGHVERDTEGRPLKVAGTLRDITERILADRELEGRVRARTASLDRSNAQLVTEIEAHKFTQKVMAGQNRILRKIAQGAPIRRVFDDLLRFGQSDSSGNFAGLLFLREGDSLTLAAAPEVAEEIKAIAAKIQVRADGGPAARAAYHGKPVAVALAADSRWQGAGELHSQGIQNVLAMPILGLENEVLGAISFAVRGEITKNQERILEACTGLAAVALQRDREQAELRRSEQAAREAEHRLQSSLDFARVTAWTWSVETDAVKCAGPVKAIYGVDSSELPSFKALRDIMVAEDREVVDRKVAESIRDGRPYASEFRIVRPDGEVRWIAGTGGAKVDENGKVLEMSGMNFDITDRKLAQEKLEASELHFRELADSMPQIIWTANAGGDFEFRNRRWYEHTGLPEQMRSPEAWLEILHADDAKEWMTAVKQAHLTGVLCEMELRLWDVTRQQYRWHLFRKKPIVTREGKVARCYGTCIDIHERKMEELKLAESEQALRKRDEQLAIVFESGSMGDYTWDFEKAQVTAHRSVWALYGYPGRFGTGPLSSFAARFHPADSEMMAERLAGAREGKWPWHFEHRVLWPDGTVHWLLSRAMTVRDEAGKPVGLHGVVFDITERKNAELQILESALELRKRNDQLAMLFDSGAIGDFTWDVETDMVTAHPSIWKFFGKEDGSGAGPSSWFIDRYHPADAEETKDKLREALEGKRPLDAEYRVKWPDGTVKWLASVGVVVRAGDGKPLQMNGLGIDITERKTAELRIEESERQLREQADAMPLMVWRCLPDGQIDYCNSHWQDFTGSTIEQTKAVGWQGIVHGDDLPKCMEEGVRGIANGNAFSMEFRVKRASDGAYRWFLAQCYPFRDQNGKLLRWFGAAVDIDDQKTLSQRLEAQVLSRTAELRQTVKEKETLLKEIHHRVKNNLQVITSLLRLQEENLGEGPAALALRDSQQRVTSMALIHERLYGGQKLDEIDFGEYARTLVQDLLSSFSERAKHVRCRVETSAVKLNIEQAVPCGLILNELVTNALKYAYPNGKGGEVHVGLSEEEGGMVTLTVADNGGGLPEGFDWNQTKSMGLPIAEMLAQQIGGRLRVRSKPGARFTVEFPKHQKQARASATAG